MSALSARAMRRARRAAAPVAIGGAALVTVFATGGVAVVIPETVAATMHGLTTLIVDDGATHPADVSAADFYQRSFTADRARVTIDFSVAPPRLNAPPETRAPAAVPAPREWPGADTRPTARGVDAQEPAARDAPIDPAPASAATRPQVDVGVASDMDGNSPVYERDGVAMANSFLAYVDRKIRRTADGFARVDEVDDTTRVSLASDDLPLTRPLRRHGGPAGARIADAIDPRLRTVADYGDADDDQPGDRRGSRRPLLVPTVRETRTFAADFTTAVRNGVRTLAGAGGPARRSAG